MEQSKLELLYQAITNETDKLSTTVTSSRLDALGEALYEVNSEDASYTDLRKAFQFAYLRQANDEKIQANHQITPDAIGYLISHILGLYNRSEFNLIDIGSGSGHLSMTVKEQLDYANLHGIEIDPTLAQLNVSLCEYMKTAMEIYPQNALEKLFLDKMDAVIGDLPIGYYPVEVDGYVTAFEEGMSYAHLLLLERGMQLVKPGGVGVFIVPSNILEENNETIKTYLKDHVSLKMFLKLPETIFKSKESGKSIMVIENVVPSEDNKEMLLLNVPDFKDSNAIKSFLNEVNHWYHQEDSDIK